MARTRFQRQHFLALKAKATKAKISLRRFTPIIVSSLDFLIWFIPVAPFITLSIQITRSVFCFDSHTQNSLFKAIVVCTGGKQNFSHVFAMLSNFTLTWGNGKWRFGVYGIQICLCVNEWRDWDWSEEIYQVSRFVNNEKISIHVSQSLKLTKLISNEMQTWILNVI